MNNKNNNDVRATLRNLMDARGLDMATVSRAIGKNHAYIQQFLNRGVPAELSYKAALALADLFECPPDAFGIKTPKTSPTPTPHPLDAIRRLMGLSTTQIAKALGEDELLIQKITQGQQGMSEKLMLKICRTFQLDPSDFAGYAPAMSPEERVLLLRLRRLNDQQKSEIENLLETFDSPTQKTANLG